MIRRHIRAIILGFLMAATAAPSLADDEGGHSIVERLAGEWTSSGDAFGASATSNMSWAPALGDKFTRLDYRIEMQRGEGKASVFEGVAFYKVDDGEAYKAFWADNSGDLHPISAEHDGDALVSHWGVEGAKQGRTRYELISNDEVQVTDWIKTPEGWRQFNQNTFVRAAASGE